MFDSREYVRSSLWLVGLAAGALVAVACGSDAGGEGSTEDSSGGAEVDTGAATETGATEAAGEEGGADAEPAGGGEDTSEASGGTAGTDDGETSAGGDTETDPATDPETGGEEDIEDPPGFEPDAEAIALFKLDDETRNDVVGGDICQRLSEVQCAAEAHCCPSPSASYDDCVKRAVATCRDDLYFDTISSDEIGGEGETWAEQTGFDAAHLKMALGTFEELALECDSSVATWGESMAGLRGMFKGSISSQFQCRPLLISELGAAAALASCLEPETYSCLPSENFLLWQCLPRGAVGEICFTDINCLEGHFCLQDNYLAPVHSECKARYEDGEACKSNNECASLACKQGECVPATNTSAYCMD